MISRQPSMKMKKREPLKRARTTATTLRRPASFLTCWKAAATIGLASLKAEERLVISSIALWYAPGSSVLRKKPRMERRVITMGKTARIRLNASPAALFQDQSLLNLVRKASKG